MFIQSEKKNKAKKPSPGFINMIKDEINTPENQYFLDPKTPLKTLSSGVPRKIKSAVDIAATLRTKKKLFHDCFFIDE